MTGKPIAPMKVPRVMGISIHPSVTCGESPSTMMTKPALLNTEIAMKTACQAAERGACPRVRNLGKKRIARRASALKDAVKTALSRPVIWPRPSDFVSWAASMRWVSPRWRETAKPRIEARVMTPRPPIMMPRAMTAWPKMVHELAVSIVVKPVTHTADTAVKRTSTKAMGRSGTVAKGRESKAVIVAMIKAKTPRARRAGA